MTFTIFKDCILVSGPTKSTICDFTNGRIIEITNKLYKILKTVDESETIDDAANKLRINKDYLYNELIEVNKKLNIGFFSKSNIIVDQLKTFQPKKINSITNVTFELSEKTEKFLNKIIFDNEMLSCFAMELCIIDIFALKKIPDILEKITLSNIEYLEICVQNSENVNIRNFLKKLVKYPIVKKVIFFNALPKIFIKNDYPFDVKLVKKKYDYNVCGIISKEYFTCNKFNLFENSHSNSCLNGKIAIDKLGNFKPCLNLNEVFGNIQKHSLESVISNKTLLKYWGISKNQVDTCKDCEYRMVCSDCRAHTINGTLKSKPKKCNYNPYSGKWLSLFILLILTFFSNCSPKINQLTTAAYNQQSSVFVNKDMGIINKLSADYRACDFSMIDISKTPIKKRKIEQIYGCAITNVPPTFAWILFTYKKKIPDILSKKEISSFNFPKQNYYIVPEDYNINGNQLYSLYIDLGDKNQPWSNRLPYESLKNEVYSIYHYQNECFNLSNLELTNNNIYQKIAFYKILKDFRDSLKFCNQFDKDVFFSIDNQYIALTKYNNDSLVVNFTKIYNILSQYDIILVKDNHSSSVEDIFLKEFIEKNPFFFKNMFLETLEETDSINNRGFPLTTSGFYFRNYSYRDLSQTCLKNHIPLLSYDFINPKCGLGIKCNQIRDSIQAVNIMNKIKPYERNVVFSGGSHSNLNCNSTYTYMGCFLCKKKLLKIAQISLNDSMVIIRNCKGIIANLKYHLKHKQKAYRFIIHENKPCIIALYKKNEYLLYKVKAIPYYTFFVLPNKKYEYQIKTDNYIAIFYNFFGNIINRKQVVFK